MDEFSLLSEREGELNDGSDTGELLLLCGAGVGFFFLQATRLSAPQQRAIESAKVNNFFIQSS